MFELWLLALVLIAAGLLGTVAPGLPGLPLVLGGVALFALGTGFAVITPWQLALFVLFGLVGLGLSALGTLFGARRFGTSRTALVGALVGLLVGLVLLGPVGLVVGALIGAVTIELARVRRVGPAIRSGLGVLLGYLLGTVAEVVAALGLAAWFVWLTFGPLMHGPGRG